MIPAAIHNKQLLSFNYHGYSRTVEPHTYGVDTKGHRALRAYQVGGSSDSGEFTGWKIFHVDEIMGMSALPAQFAGPRQGYKRDDKAFATIHAQL